MFGKMAGWTLNRLWYWICAHHTNLFQEINESWGENIYMSIFINVMQ